MKKSFFLSVFCLLAPILLTSVLASDDAAKPIVIRFSHVVAEDTPKGIGAQMFKKLVEQRLPGKVVVEVYPRSEKFTDEEAIVAMLLGDVEMVAPSFPKFCRFSKALQVFDIPFMFEDVNKVHQFQQSESGQKLLASMEGIGIKGLRYWDNGMRVLSANKPVKTPQDLKGLRFRIESSHVFHSQYASLGATTTVLPYKRLVDALKMGVVDGYENSWSNIRASKLYLLRKNYTEINHSFLGYMVATSVAFWEGLPDDIRQELDRTLDEVTAEVNRLAAEKSLADKAALLQEGMVQVVSLNEKEKQQWSDLLDPVALQFAGEIDPQILLAAKQVKN
jgi:C4-dicarboxylate-binding protein DctP